MRLLAPALVLLLMLAHPAWGAIAFVKNVAQATQTATDNKIVVTTGVAVASGNRLIVVAFRVNAADTISSVTDSKGNTYTIDKAAFELLSADNYRTMVASSNLTTALTATDTVTVQWTNAAAFNNFFAQLTEYSGIASTGAADQSSNATAFHLQVDGITSGATPTTTQADELLFGFIGVEDAARVLSAGINYTMRPQKQFAGATIGVEDRIVSVTGAYAATGSWDGTTNQTEGAVIVTYKGAAAAAAPLKRPAEPLTGIGVGGPFFKDPLP